MTLSTRLAVLDPVPVREMFDEVRTALGAGPGVPIVESNRGASRSISHPLGQGLAAWAILDYGVERPLVPDTDDSLPSGSFVDLCLDTAWGYRDEHGGARELHARIVDALGRWLDDRDKRWRWHDEYTDTWHDGPATGVLGLLP